MTVKKSSGIPPAVPRQMQAAIPATRSVAKWYCDPYRWLILGPPLTAIVAGLLTLYLAITSYDGLVVDDYYRAGLEINQVLARDKRADALGLRLRLDWDPTVEEIVLTLVHDRKRLLSTLDIALIYSARAGYDRTFNHVRPDENGRYHIAFKQPRFGRWDLQVMGRDWRLQDSLFIHAPEP